MGCASSSPLVNGGGPGGLVDNAKTAATEVMNAGENAMNEMNENISETAGQIKETVVETVNGMKESIGDVINEGMTKIPLKDTMENTNHLLEENLENLKNEMLNKTQSIGDETDKIADELIKDTEDVIRDAETGIVDMKNSALDMMNEFNLPSPSHSIETIQTSAPEPEIEKLLNGDENMESPEATVDELENLNKESEESPSAPEESESKPEDEEAPTMKQEDELVVEDIKDELYSKFHKLSVVQESESSEEDDDEPAKESKEDLAKRELQAQLDWEAQQTLFLQSQLMVRTMDSDDEDDEPAKKSDNEDDFEINLANIYQEPAEEQMSVKSVSASKEPSIASFDMTENSEKATAEDVSYGDFLDSQ